MSGQSIRQRRVNLPKVIYADESWRARLERFETDWLAEKPTDRLTLVKASAVRQVYRLELPDATFYVKRHVGRGVVQRVKGLLRGSPARIEYRASRYTTEHGVPAIQIAAYGKANEGNAGLVSWTVSPALEGARTLAAAYRGASALADRPARRSAVADLTESTARLLATAHEAAFLHPDNHPRNILVQRAADGKTACLFVDLYGARCGRVVSDSEAARSLAALDMWFAGRASRTNRLRFLRSYCAWRNKPRRALARLVSGSVRRHARTLYRKRDRRIGRNNAYFAAFDLPDGRRAAFTRRFRNLAELLPVVTPQADPEEWKRRLTEEAHGSCEALDLPGQSCGVVAEDFFAPSWLSGLIWCLLGSPAWRRYRTACQAVNRDIPIAAGLACICSRHSGIVDRASWLMLRPCGSEPLVRWLKKRSGRARHRVLEDVGRLVTETADKGLGLRRLDVSRLEVASSAEEDAVVFWAGVEGVSLSSSTSEPAALCMLTDLARSVQLLTSVQRTDQARVLRACWIRVGGPGRTDGWKVWWRRIEDIIIGPAGEHGGR